MLEFLFKEKHWREDPKVVEVCPDASIDCLYSQQLSGKLFSRKSDEEKTALSNIIKIRKRIKEGKYSDEDIKEIKKIAGLAVNSIISDGDTDLNWVLLRECLPMGCISKNDIYKMLRSSNVNKADLLKYVLSQEYIAQSDWGADILKRVMGSEVNSNEASLFLTHVFNKPHWSAHEKAPEFYEKIFANLDGADAKPLFNAFLDKSYSQENYLALAKGVLAKRSGQVTHGVPLF